MIDYAEGDRIICIYQFSPGDSISGGPPPVIPELGEVYTARQILERPEYSAPPYLGVELEEIREWSWQASAFRKVPKLPPKEVGRNQKVSELIDA